MSAATDSPTAPAPTPASISYAKVAKKASNENDTTVEDPGVEVPASNPRASAPNSEEHGSTEPRWLKIIHALSQLVK